MYGVPADLDLGLLGGAELTQVCLGLYQVQFLFHPVGTICVAGAWELLDAGGARLDGRHDGPDRRPFQLHRLLGRRVAGFEVAAPDWLALRFEGGEVLRVFDDDPQYESFQIEPGGIIV